MLTKILVTVAIVWLAWALLSRGAAARRRGGAGGGRRRLPSIDLARCPQCGVFRLGSSGGCSCPRPPARR